MKMQLYSVVQVVGLLLMASGTIKLTFPFIKFISYRAKIQRFNRAKFRAKM